MKNTTTVLKETMIGYGADTLTFHELLQVLIGKENEETLSELKKYPLKEIINYSQADFQQVPGIGKVIAERLFVAMQLSKKIMVEECKEVSRILSPQDAANVFKFLKFEKQEHVCVAFLNVKYEIIGCRTIFIGSLDSAILHPREVFKEAIARSAHSIIVAHNHPSGDPIPSEEDLAVTQALVKAGKLLGIQLTDHIIIGSRNHCSLQEKGYIF